MGDSTYCQERIKNWKQQNIKEGNVVIVGSGSLANYVLLYLTGLEFGNVRIIDNKKTTDRNDFLNVNQIQNYSKVKSMENKIIEINPTIKIQGIDSYFSGSFVRSADVIVDLTNEFETKMVVLDYCKKMNLPFISASTSENKGAVAFYKRDEFINREKDRSLDEILFKKYKPKNKSLEFMNEEYKKDEKTILKENDLLMKEFSDAKQGGITSGLIGAIVCDEIRKSVLKLNDDDRNLEKKLTYNLKSLNRFSEKDDLRYNRSEDFSGKKVLVVGAGAVGNYVALGLAQMRVGTIDLVDMDCIDKTNMNRQLLFYGRVDEPKVKVLAQRVREIYPESHIRSIYGKLGMEPTFEEKRKGARKVEAKELIEERYDAIFCCLDNNKSKIILNNIATKNKIPVIYGGTDSAGGQVAVYKPGETACIVCQAAITEEEEIVRNSCVSPDHEPSVVYTNAAIAFAMLGEARTLLNPETYGPVIKSEIFYRSFGKTRMKLNDTRIRKCSHS
jgi:molybdopterin/thiamine biosynthesis adenylyltransferase